MELNREKQIAEIARVIYENTAISCVEIADEIAEELYTAGYRKASEVAREIFEEVEEKANAIYKSVQYGCYSYMRYGSLGTDSPDAQRQMGKLDGVKHLGDVIAELKKKYTENKGE